MAQNLYPPAFLRPDGASRQGYIQPIKGLYEAVRFTYRPMRPMQLGKLMTAVGKCGAEQDQSWLLQAQWLVQNLLEWDVKDGSTPVAVNADNFIALHPEAFLRIVNIITGREPSDIEYSPEHMEDSTSQNLVERYGGKEDESPEVANEKNS